MRKVTIGFILALAPSAGCVALLGDFDVNPTVDAGLAETAPPTDGPPTDDSRADAAVDAFDAQTPPFTTCGVSGTRLIDTIDDPALGFDDNTLQTFRAGNVVRVVAQRRGSPGAQVYSFDPKSGAPGAPVVAKKVDPSATGRFLDVRKLTAQGILALLFLEPEIGDPTAVRLRVFELPDADLMANQPFRVSEKFPAPPAGGTVSGALGAYAQNNEYFWAVSVPAVTPGNADLLIGHRVNAASLPTPVKIYSGNEREARVRNLARSEKVQYVFNDRGPDAPGQPGSSYFRVPDDTLAGPINPTSLMPAGGTKPFVVLGVSGIATGSGIRAAFAEVDFAGGSGTPGQLRIGEIPPAALPTFNGTTVPPAFTIMSLLEVPLGNFEARFFGDEFLWIGTPPAPQQGQGLNFIWFNIKDRVVRSRQVGTGKLLADHLTIGRVSLALTTSSAFSAELDVVFTEVVGGKSLLQHATMNCVR